MRASIVIPDGWRQVKRGKVRATDMQFWMDMDDGTCKWKTIGPEEIDAAVCYWAEPALSVRGWGLVIRKEDS